MATNPKTTLANTIANLKRDIDEKNTHYKAYTDQLIVLVGDEGETFNTTEGDVQVTQRTEDRSTDELVVSFDRDVFMSLDTRAQNRLTRMGVIKIQPKEITGQAPKVVVRLK